MVPSGAERRERLALVPEPETDLFDRWRTLITSVEAAYVELPDLIVGAWPFMEQFWVSSVQAVHAAMVRQVAAEGLVTTEPEYGRVEESMLTLWVPARRRDDALQRRPRARHVPAVR